MLLNQCLAISLTQVTETTTSIPTGEQNEFQEKEEKIINQNKANNETQADSRNLQINHSTALTLFKQIIEQNLAQLAGRASPESDQLGRALKRVEFAGFLVPSWLLLSGTFNDLRCIKASWRNGSFRATGNFKIETIGKY